MRKKKKKMKKSDSRVDLERQNIYENQMGNRERERRRRRARTISDEIHLAMYSSSSVHERQLSGKTGIDHHHPPLPLSRSVVESDNWQCPEESLLEDGMKNAPHVSGALLS